MTTTRIPAPFTASLSVRPEWLDLNGHMNVAFYLSAFDQGSDPFFDYCGLGWDYTRAGQGSMFATGCNLDFRAELLADDRLEVTTRLLDCSAKLLHLYCEIHRGRDGELAATQEALFMHVSLTSRRSMPLPEAAQARLAEVLLAHSSLPTPASLGRVLGIHRPSS